MKLLVPGVLVAALAILALDAHAQAFPSKPMRIIVPFTPGGFNDTLARTLAAELPKTLGQPMVVENKPGGNTLIGTDAAAKSAPDGHTLFVAALPFAVVQSLHKAPFDVTKDFAPITLAGISANMLVARADFPANTLRDLLKVAGDKPGKVNYASSGNGSSPHLSMELLKAMTRTSMVHIPFKGSAPAVTALLAGQVDIAFDNVPNVINHVRAGKLKALAVTTASRSALAPEVPTIAEGGVPGYDVSVWFGVLAPAGTPRQAIERLNSEITKLLNTAEVKERFAKQGVDVRTSTPEQFGAFVKQEVARWAKVIREAEIKPD
jgi:tripartite-type tricarboxylate transporter receptor subunit TctC